MLRLFLIALVVVAPYGVVTARRIMRRPTRPDPADGAALDDPSTAQPSEHTATLAGPTLDGPHDPDDLRRIVALLERRAVGDEVSVGAAPALDGRPVSDEVARALIEDVARQRSMRCGPWAPRAGGGWSCTLIELGDDPMR